MTNLAIENSVYLICVFILTTGLYIMLSSYNYIKKIIGLSIFQSAVILFYIALGKVKQGIAPIIYEQDSDYTKYSHPLPHVLMLTAIVVGIATVSLAVSLVIKIKQNYGTIEENELENI